MTDEGETETERKHPHSSPARRHLPPRGRGRGKEAGTALRAYSSRKRGAFAAKIARRLPPTFCRKKRDFAPSALRAAGFSPSPLLRQHKNKSTPKGALRGAGTALRAYSSRKRGAFAAKIARRLPPPFCRQKRDFAPSALRAAGFSPSPLLRQHKKRHLAVPVLAEKRGFEPRRRKTRPNGLANRPLRPAWVLLQNPIRRPFSVGSISIIAAAPPFVKAFAQKIAGTLDRRRGR